MDDLRIILLVVGVLFIGGIFCFEWWRARGQRPAPAVSRGNARFNDGGAGYNDDGVERFSDGSTNRFTESGSARSNNAASARTEGGNAYPADANEPPATRGAHDVKALPEINVVRESAISSTESLPVIELASSTDTGTRRALGISISDDVAVDSVGRAEPYIGPHDEVSAVRIVDESAAPVVTPPLTLSWPSEAERRIVALRVMPKSEPRFAGRALRQAFSGSGFSHGPMDIFHLPDEQGRVLLSAAALAQPGTFDPSIMDSQRFSGLNLFAVLPGPAPQSEVFEELVHAARQLAERLDGLITDQHGEELTAGRIARLRQSLAGGSPARAAGES